MKFQKSLTPILTDIGLVNYFTLFDGLVIKILMKSSLGFPPWNLTTPKISFLTFIPLIPTNLDPYLVYNLLLPLPIPFHYFFLKLSLSPYITSLCIFPDLSNLSIFSRKQNFMYNQKKKNYKKFFYSTISCTLSTSTSPSASFSSSYQLSSNISTALPNFFTIPFKTLACPPPDPST